MRSRHVCGSNVGIVDATATGATVVGANPSTSLAANGETFAVTIGANTTTFTFASAGVSSGSTISTADPATDTIAEVLAYMQTKIQVGNPEAANLTAPDPGLSNDGVERLVWFTLLTEGNTEAAIRLENLWDEVTRSYKLPLQTKILACHSREFVPNTRRFMDEH